MIAAIIVAAGSSRRMGFDKLAVELAGVPVLARSISAFEASASISRVLVVTTPERFAWLDALKAAHGWTKLEAIVEGDAERHLSVCRGLDALPAGTRIVAVHDGARPLVSPQSIDACVAEAEKSGAASLAHPVADTLKRATKEGMVTESVSRENLWAMETPQAFDLGLLRRAYDAVLSSGELMTDEVSAIQAIGEPVRLVKNDLPNPKITYPSDITLAEAILSSGS